MIVQVKLPAAEHQRFAPGCFDAQVGGSFPFEGRPAVLQSYEVTGDGTAVLLTVDVENLDRSFYASEPDVEA